MGGSKLDGDGAQPAWTDAGWLQRDRTTRHNSFSAHGLRYTLGDMVYLQPADEGQLLYIAELLGLSEDAQGEMWATVRWFYRAEELELKGGLSAEANEIFYTDEQGTHPLNSVAGKTAVLTPSEFWQQARGGGSLHNCWMCRRDYNTDSRSIAPLTKPLHSAQVFPASRPGAAVGHDPTSGLPGGLSGNKRAAPEPLSQPSADVLQQAMDAEEFGSMLDARPVAVVGGKVMQRGGPDTAASLADALVALEKEVPSRAADAGWAAAQEGWRGRAATARTIRDLADCLAELEAGLGLCYPPGSELADGGTRSAWRARMRSLHTYPTLAAALATFSRSTRAAIARVGQQSGSMHAAAAANPTTTACPTSSRSPAATASPPPAAKRQRGPGKTAATSIKQEPKQKAAAARKNAAPAAQRSSVAKSSSEKDVHGRWSRERYATAQAALVRILDGMGARNPTTAVLRPALREEARKAIGDTGLLDHLLKHAAEAVVTDEGHRLRRRHNREGHMEYWLQRPTDTDAATEEDMLEEEAGNTAAEVARLRAARSALTAAANEAEAALATTQHDAAAAAAEGDGEEARSLQVVARRLAVAEEGSAGRHEALAAALFGLRNTVAQQQSKIEMLQREVALLRRQQQQLALQPQQAHYAPPHLQQQPPVSPFQSFSPGGGNGRAQDWQRQMPPSQPPHTSVHHGVGPSAADVLVRMAGRDVASPQLAGGWRLQPSQPPLQHGVSAAGTVQVLAAAERIAAAVSTPFATAAAPVIAEAGEGEPPNGSAAEEKGLCLFPAASLRLELPNTSDHFGGGAENGGGRIPGCLSAVDIQSCLPSSSASLPAHKTSPDGARGGNSIRNGNGTHNHGEDAEQHPDRGAAREGQGLPGQYPGVAAVRSPNNLSRGSDGSNGSNGAFRAVGHPGGNGGGGGKDTQGGTSSHYGGRSAAGMHEMPKRQAGSGESSSKQLQSALDRCAGLGAGRGGKVRPAIPPGMQDYCSAEDSDSAEPQSPKAAGNLAKAARDSPDTPATPAAPGGTSVRLLRRRQQEYATPRQGAQVFEEPQQPPPLPAAPPRSPPHQYATAEPHGMEGNPQQAQPQWGARICSSLVRQPAALWQHHQQWPAAVLRGSEADASQNKMEAVDLASPELRLPQLRVAPAAAAMLSHSPSSGGVRLQPQTASWLETCGNSSSPEPGSTHHLPQQELECKPTSTQGWSRIAADDRGGSGNVTVSGGSCAPLPVVPSSGQISSGIFEGLSDLEWAL